MTPFYSRPFRVAVLDFDGTLSLIREGWSRIMAEVGRDVLLKQNRNVDESILKRFEDQMLRLSGRPSLVQMQKLAEELLALGAKPPSPELLHDDFLRRLFSQIEGRKRDLANGTVLPESWTVPGTHDLLNELQKRNAVLYLVSGTDLAAVREEAALLKLTEYFGDRVFAPSDLTPHFHKRDALAQILRACQIQPHELIGFGDGFSETVEVKKIGGCVVGVASVEVGKTGPNRHKTELLTEWGADIIVPDYRNAKSIVAQLWGNG